MPNIHPTAIVDKTARLGDDVEVGAYCIVEADVVIGAGSALRPHAMIRRHTTLGEGNSVDSFCVLGGEPQDHKFDPDTTSYLRIGDHNIFREGVTISRATGEGKATTVGSKTHWMAGSHAGHNAQIADEVILTNCAALAGHTVVGRRAILSARASVHQFCWIGEMVLLQGHAAVTMHVPPYTLAIIPINSVGGLNTVGLQRAPYVTREDRLQIKEAFKLTYRSKLPLAEALEKMGQCTDWGEGASKFRQFIRNVLEAEEPHNRGLCPLRPRGRANR